MKRHPLPLTLSAIGALIALLLCTPAGAALDAYLRLEGEAQGEIDGGSTRVGREDLIIVKAIDFPMNTGRGPGTLTIRKDVDKATPLLHSAMFNGEVMGTFRLEMFRPSADGSEVHYFTVELIGARITAIDTSMLHNSNPNLMQYPIAETVTFEFASYQMIYEVNGVAGP